MFAFLKNTKTILIGLICALYIGMFLPIAISNIPLIALLLFCLVKTSPKEILQTLKENSFPKIMAGLYLLLIIGLLYTTNYRTGFFVLEKKLSLLLLPLLLLPLFIKVNVTESNIYRAIGYFTYLSSFVLLGVAVYRQIILNDSQAFHFDHFTSPLIHYVYYAMYFAIGSLFLIDSWFDTLVKSKSGIAILVLLFLYSLIFLVLVASKTGIIAFGLSSIYFLFRKIQNRKIFVLSLVILLLSTSVVLYFNDTTRTRFTELRQNLSILTRDQLGDWNEEVITGLNMRLLFWKISVVHSWRDNLFFTGIGTGDTQDYLNSLYTNPKYNRYGYVGWDSHNEWIFTFVQVGIVSVSLMALLYVLFFRKAILQNDMKLLSFLLITLAFSMSESILESNKGIVFFSLFFTLLSTPYSVKVLPDNSLATN